MHNVKMVFQFQHVSFMDMEFFLKSHYFVFSPPLSMHRMMTQATFNWSSLFHSSSVSAMDSSNKITQLLMGPLSQAEFPSSAPRRFLNLGNVYSSVSQLPELLISLTDGLMGVAVLDVMEGW